MILIMSGNRMPGYVIKNVVIQLLEQEFSLGMYK